MNGSNQFCYGNIGWASFHHLYNFLKFGEPFRVQNEPKAHAPVDLPDIALLQFGRGAVGVFQFNFQGQPIHHNPHIRQAAFLIPAPTISHGLDSAKLKKKYPDAAADCAKDTPKAGYVKITLKDGGGENGA